MPDQQLSSALPPTLEQSLRRELIAGEHLLWRGQPRPNKLTRGFGIWLFALPWTAFALMWEAFAFLPWVTALKTPDWLQWSFGIVFPLFGLPFIAVGLWMLWAPIHALRRAGKTAYALTERRLLRVVEAREITVASVLLHQIGPIDRREDSQGFGDLRIQTHSTVDSEGDRTTERFEVLGVPGVARLERLILENLATKG
ncbi:hypothetical protein KRR38_09945 [Novosphingobium sp. G106]|uniref:hypothetical protein n=1 Tax=Novosphingobium sp. G106 TaxID=2849500 RepID=UPI001C2CCE5D|nr:hypothetical protein [Novosphingobium sp. G106]MBV1687987.1 hypothetical protein [Novosphingobium sp. G106]